MGYFLMATAALVLFPVFLQVRSGEHGVRAVWGYILFAVGLFSVGASYTWLTGDSQRNVVLAGFAAVLIGLLVEERDRTARKY